MSQMTNFWAPYENFHRPPYENIDISSTEHLLQPTGFGRQNIFPGDK